MSRLDLSDPALLEALAAALTAAGVDGIEIEQPAGKLRIVVDGRGSGGPVRVDALSRGAALKADIVAAPCAGLFDQDPSAGPLPRTVAAGEILAFLRIGPVLLPVRASRAGTVARCLAGDGSLVGFGDPLFEMGLAS